MQTLTTLSATSTNPTSLETQAPEKKYVKVEWAGSGNIVGGVAHPYTNVDTIGSLLQRLTGHLLGPKGSEYTGHDVYLEQDFIEKFSVSKRKRLDEIEYSTDILNLVVVKRRELESVASLKGSLIDVLANSPSPNQKDRIFEIVLSLYGSTASFKQKREEAKGVMFNRRPIDERFMKELILDIGSLGLIDELIQAMNEKKVDNFFLLSEVIHYYSVTFSYTPSDLGKLRDMAAEMDLESSERENINMHIDRLEKDMNDLIDFKRGQESKGDSR
ncbi:MAG: hypothetical protein SP4CHLAM5_05830 [Chlamydiia bacterium]|nr:hypothetical protein [Chlamydiia bacterium]MCH9618453.1 hypothetical protein [Chlamydiia bacterium]MCH9623915.1 hypothetical protein [Chlamydiia bacterium]